jgi:hypothetical protein
MSLANTVPKIYLVELILAMLFLFYAIDIETNILFSDSGCFTFAVHASIIVVNISLTFD